MIKFKILSIALCLVFLLIGCSEKTKPDNTQTPKALPQSSDSEQTAAKADIEGMDFTFSTRDTNDTYNSNTAKQILLSDSDNLPEGVKKENSQIIIQKANTYIVKGNATDISLVINIPENEKIQIILDSVNIANKNGPAIFIKQAEKVVLTLADGSENIISDGDSYALTDDDATLDAALFSKEDLSINGSGTLTVNGNFKHGIVSKDDLVITNGTINVTAKNVALNGKDCVKISDAKLNLVAGSDGIRSDNEEDADKGYIYINSGDINITAENDGIQSVTLTKILGGNISIETGGGSANASTNNDGSFNNNWQFGPNRFYEDSAATTNNTESAKGIKSQNTVIISGGTIYIDSSDDSIHSNNLVEISNGNITCSSGDDGIHADTTLKVSGGEILISKSYEGIESSTINVSGGNIIVTASDDGINAAGGNDSSALGNRPGMNNFSRSTGVINISGGYILVDASGDGVDSNGDINISGGVTLVSGPTNSGNGSFDYESKATVSGGVLIATGSLGMAQGFTDAQNQGAIMVSVGTNNGGTNIAVCDKDGKAVVSFTPKKAYQSLVVTAPKITTGNQYSIVLGGTVSGADKNGYGENLEITGGNTVTTISLTSNLYNSGSSFGGNGGFGGGDHGGGPMGTREPGGRK